MAAGTVISGGFPGRVAREVFPNQKCEGCLHYDPQGGRTGVCTIGLRPDNCGHGEAPDVSYAPIARGAGSYLPGMSNHPAQASETGPQPVFALHGSGSSRPVAIHQVSLGEEHLHVVKSVLGRHTELQKAQCLRCSMAGARGPAAHNTDPQLCTCRPIEAEVVAKAVVATMSNALRARVPLDAVTEWVRAVAKAGLRLPEPAARTAADDLADALAEMGVRVDGRSDDRSDGHLRPVEKGLFGGKPAGFARSPTPQVPATRSESHGTYHVHLINNGKHFKTTYSRNVGGQEHAPEHLGSPGSFKEAGKLVDAHHAKVASKGGDRGDVAKSVYSDEWIVQFKGTPLFDEARALWERELAMEEDELRRNEARLKHERATRAAIEKLPKLDSEDWQAREARRTKIRIAKQRLILKLAGLHQQKMSVAKAEGSAAPRVTNHKSPHGSYKIEHHADHAVVHYKPGEGSPAPAQVAKMKSGEHATKMAKIHALVNDHDFPGHATLHEDHVKLHDKETGESHKTTSMSHAREFLGY